MTSRYRDFSSSSLTSPRASFNTRRERSCSPCSRFETCHSPTMGKTSRKNFSSSSFTGYSRHSYPKVSVNKWLLTPLHLDIDPTFQEIRNKEKEEMKTLNNQFAALIGKVQSLEQHNQVLLTRWNFLKEQDNSLSDLDIKLLYDQYMNRLRLETRSIDNEKEQLESELDEVLEAMDGVRAKYEEEINKRTGIEFTFTVLKKDLDNSFLHKTELEAKLAGLHAWVELMKTVQEQELEELLSQTKDVSIVLGIDNNRYSPDLHKIVEDVRAQYEALAIRSWEELEALTRSKLNEREVLSVKYGDHLLHDRRVIAELNIQIQKMRSYIVSLKSQCLRLEDNIKEAGEQGEAALKDAKAKLATLEEALHHAKQDMAQLVKEYQELMNIKLALDIEILTYRKLMEGEEISMESPPPAVISRIYSTPKLFSSDTTTTTPSNVAPRAKEKSTDKMSHSRSNAQSEFSRNQRGGSMGDTSGDLSRSHSNRSAGTPSGSLSRIHSSVSGGASEAVRSHSTTHRASLESSHSRSPSSKSRNFADIEDPTSSSVSRNLSHGSGSHRSRDNPEASLSRSHSGGIRGIPDDSLSRSQSNKSDGLSDSVFTRTRSGTSDSVQEGNYSRSQSHRSVGFSPSSISRTQSRESNSLTVTTSPGDHNSGSGPVLEGNYSRSQSGGSGELAESSLARIHSHESEGVSDCSLYGSYSGSSASYVEGGLSRTQSDENQFHSSAEPIFSRSRSADYGGVPVGGISTSQIRAGRGVSEGDPSRSQHNENELQGSQSHGEYGELISQSRSAEDGGVPVGGISRSQSGISREVSETNLSRNQSGENDEPVVSRTSTAEEDGVPVSGISRGQSGASRTISEGSFSRDQSDENDLHDNDKNAQPLVSRTSSAEEGKVSVGNVSRSSSRGSKNKSEGSFSGSPTEIFTKTLTEDAPQGSLSSQPCDINATSREGEVTRSHSGGERGMPQGSGFRTPSVRSATLTDSVFIRTPSSADEDVHEELTSRMHSEARESAPDVNLSENLHHRNEGLSRLRSGASGSDSSQPRRQSSLTRSQSKRIRDLTESLFGRIQSSTSEDGPSKGQNDEHESFIEGKASRRHSRGSGAFVEPSVSRTHSSGSTGNTGGVASRSNSGRDRSGRCVGGGLSEDHSNKSIESESDTRGSLASQSEASKDALESGPSRSTDALADSFSRSHSDKSEGPVEVSTPITPCRRNEGSRGQNLSRSQSGESGSFKAADLYRSSSEVSRGDSEASLSRSSSRENENFPEGILSRNYSYRCAVISHPHVSRSESGESEYLPEDDLSRSCSSGNERFSQPEMQRSQSGNSKEVSEGSVSRSCSSRTEEASLDNRCISRPGGNEAFPESGLYKQEDASHSHSVASVGQRDESGGNLYRTQSSELVASSPGCLIYEVSSDEQLYSPTGEE